MCSKDVKLSNSLEQILTVKNIKLTKKLGEGSYAKVYLAENIQNSNSSRETKLACKIVDAGKAPRDFVKKFLPRELDILLKINHPHIVHIHSIFQRQSKYFIMMRFAEGGDLLEFVQKNGPLSENQTRVWARQIALAIQYLHEMDIAHRDLKCENILITHNQNVKLSDFGFSRFCVDPKGFPLLSNTYCGSVSYAAPEILRGIPYIPKSADIWSFGILLYVLLNKSMPFDDTHVKKLYDLQVKKKWKFRSKVVGQLSDKVISLIKYMMEPEVVKRITITQVVFSEWIAMDSRLTVLSVAERAALAKAKDDKTYMEPNEKLKKGTFDNIKSTEPPGNFNVANETIDFKEASNTIDRETESVALPIKM